jgi:hypothetical protein
MRFTRGDVRDIVSSKSTTGLLSVADKRCSREAPSFREILGCSIAFQHNRREADIRLSDEIGVLD